MALLTDSNYVLQQLRLVSLSNDGTIAERIIQMPTIDGVEENSFYEPIFEPQVNETDSFFASARPSKAKRALLARQLAQDIQETHETKGQDNPNHGPNSSKDSVQLFGSNSTSNIFEKIQSSKKENSSTLTNLIQAKSSISNPFLQYSTYCGKGEPKPITMKIWIPFSEGKKKPMEVVVKRDSTVEDVVGYALYQYTDEARLPPALSSIEAYSLRIVEDDGAIDDDFPALERGRKIEKFSFDQFALCEQNREKFLAAENAKKAAAQKSVQKKTGSSHIFLKIHLYSTMEIKHTTSISAASEEKLDDLLKRLCKKHSLEYDDYTLRLQDTKTDVPLDKTVGETNVSVLCLLKKKQNSAGDIFVRPFGERTEEVPETRISKMAINEFSAFKKYTVWRRMPMFGAKQERILALDGALIHFFPPENKAIFDKGKSSSYPMSDIISCEQKGDNLIRLTLRRDKDQKVYDFEIESPEETDEIIYRLKFKK